MIQNRKKEEAAKAPRLYLQRIWYDLIQVATTRVIHSDESYPSMMICSERVTLVSNSPEHIIILEFDSSEQISLVSNSTDGSDTSIMIRSGELDTSVIYSE